jgi:7-cyano-7-deazaguanine synthase
MCAIFGALCSIRDDKQAAQAQTILNHIFLRSKDRGRDGVGYVVIDNHGGHLNSSVTEFDVDVCPPPRISDLRQFTVLGNYRAEPTTEYVDSKNTVDQQPYSMNGWVAVHNGTIANDKEIRSNQYPSTIDSAAVVEALSLRTRLPTEERNSWEAFDLAIRDIQGSYAIAAVDTMVPEPLLYLATNYKPIWILQTEYGIFFASSEEYFPSWCAPRRLRPYTVSQMGPQGVRLLLPLLNATPRKALVVCSGGLDSVVSATWSAKQYDTALLHFHYGCNAQEQEIKAITEVAEFLNVPVYHHNMAGIYDAQDSPILRPKTGVIAEGETGAEFAHEWVPARNLVMLSIATAIAEANGFDLLVLGNNLEESGAYPDNEQEFIHSFNKMLPYAVGPGKQVRVEMPVGNLMKREIVKLGQELGAPMHLTWSCYHGADKHCGHCGPCYMRKKAFKMAGIPDPIQYEVE